MYEELQMWTGVGGKWKSRVPLWQEMGGGHCTRFSSGSSTHVIISAYICVLMCDG